IGERDGGTDRFLYDSLLSAPEHGDDCVAAMQDAGFAALCSPAFYRDIRVLGFTVGVAFEFKDCISCEDIGGPVGQRIAEEHVGNRMSFCCCQCLRLDTRFWDVGDECCLINVGSELGKGYASAS